GRPGGELDRPLGGHPARVIAVEGQDQLLGLAFQQPDLVLGERRARGGHHVLDPALPGGDGVEVALHQDRMLGLVDGAAGPVQVEERAALVVEGGLGGVQILGLLGLFQDPAGCSTRTWWKYLAASWLSCPMTRCSSRRRPLSGLASSSTPAFSARSRSAPRKSTCSMSMMKVNMSPPLLQP